MRAASSHRSAVVAHRLPRESDGWSVVSDEEHRRPHRSERGARTIHRPAVMTVLAVLVLVLLSALLARAGGVSL
jgi:hypothetical protein